MLSLQKLNVNDYRKCSCPPHKHISLCVRYTLKNMKNMKTIVDTCDIRYVCAYFQPKKKIFLHVINKSTEKSLNTAKTTIIIGPKIKDFKIQYSCLTEIVNGKFEKT